VTRPRSDTRRRIQTVARDLFARQGVERTSLQDIADELGITKPALYYHFSSREELVRSILVPLIEEGDRFVADQESRGGADARAVVEGFFDFHFRHQQDLMLILADPTVLTDLGLVDAVIGWHERLGKLLFGPRPTLEQAARAVVAFGGLQDCCVHFRDTPYEELREASVRAGLAALGV
jgi:AcrR family transcriptional regulator